MLAPNTNTDVPFVVNFDYRVKWRWHGILVEPRRELTAAKALLDRLHIITLAPFWTEQVCHRGGARRAVRRMILPGYLLLPAKVGWEAPWETIRACIPGVRKRTYVADERGEPALMRNEEVEWLRGKEHELNLPPPPPREYQPGETVRIVEGPFMGHNATVLEVASKGRISIEVPVFGRPTPMWLPVSGIEPI